MLTRLALTAWEAALPPAISAALNCIFFVLQVSSRLIRTGP